MDAVGEESGDGGVIESNVPECWFELIVAFIEKLPAPVVMLKLLLTREKQSGITVTSPIASRDVHLRSSSMAEG